MTRTDPLADANEFNQEFNRARALMAAGRTGYGDALALMRKNLPRIRNARACGALNQQIWNCERALSNGWRFFSQSGQDSWLDTNVFHRKHGGTFVEIGGYIGGYDGISGSNCLFFELNRGWTGLLVEPSPGLHARAKLARRCECLHLAVAGAAGEAEFLDVEAGLTQMGGLIDSYDPATLAAVKADPRHKGAVIRVSTRPLADILDAHGLTEIDYISLDVEGGEMAVLSAFPFEKYRIAAWTIENNSGGQQISELMPANGYRLAEALGVDEIYLRAAN